MNLQFRTEADYVRGVAANGNLAVISRKMAGEALGLSQATIERYIQTGTLRSAKIGATTCVLANSVNLLLEEAQDQVKTVHKFLEQVAGRRETVFYEPVMTLIGMTTRHPRHRDRIGHILGQVSNLTMKARTPHMLSAIVVRKDHWQRPSAQFYELAKMHGLKLDDDAAYRAYLEFVWDIYA